MRFLKTLVAAAGLVFAAACSDTSNQMTGIDPSFAKVGKGGFGDPHFTADNTVCTFNHLTGDLACNYQIAGLSAYSTGDILLQGNPVVYYSCSYSDTDIRERVTLAYDVGGTYYADKSGNAKGVVEATPGYLLSLLEPKCPTRYVSGVGFVKPDPSDFWFELNEQSVPVVLPGLLPLGWSLDALVSTPKGGSHPIFYIGDWVVPAE